MKFLVEKTWSNLRLQTKLIVAFLLVVITASLVATGIIGFSTKYFFREYVNNFTQSKVDQWGDYFSTFYKKNNNSWDGIDKLYSKSTLFPPGFFFAGGKASIDRIILIDLDGKVLADTNDVSLTPKKHTVKKTKTVRAPIYANGQVVGKIVVTVNSPFEGIFGLEKNFYKSVINGTIIVNAIAFLCAILLAIFFSRRISIPLVYLTQATDKLAEKDFKYRLFLPWEDEIGYLAKAFNTMADVIEQKEEIKNRLIADMAHELRTPVTVLLGNLESLQAGVLEPSPEVIISLHDEVLRLSRLISDLQEISLAESGKIVLNFERLSTCEILSTVVTKFRGVASGKHIELQLDIPKEDLFVEADRDRIIQVLSNIIANAVRHTPENGVIVASLSSFIQNQVIFSISDSGQGIDPQDLPFVFDRFYRGSKSRNRSDGGAGLGLAIAKSLVVAHGGKVAVQCPLDGGSVFNIILSKAT